MDSVNDSDHVGKDEPTFRPEKPKKPGQKTYRRLEVPTAEMMAQEDMMNNCAVRTVLSGAMGSVLGVVFGIFMGTMDSSVRCLCLCLLL